MSFNDVLGQELAVTVLKNSLQQERLHHAYLFTGEQGVGKAQTAFEFAKAINCKTKVDDACDECISCRKAVSGNHPDLKKIKPDGAYLKIDQIRNLQQEIFYKPYESGQKIYIIYQAEQLTAEAANCLLKTLENPPEHGIIILLANNLNQLLPTVISRCELVRFKRLPQAAINKQLAIDYNLEPTKRDLISALSFGKYSTAIKLVEEEGKLAWRAEIIEILLSLSDLDRIMVFEVVQTILNYKEQLEEVLSIFSTWYRDILLCQLNQTDTLVNVDYKEELNNRAKELTIEQVKEILDIISETSNTIRHTNVNLQLTLEVMLLKLNRVKQGGKIND